ncbi:unnamed protein product [Periconia digitata]|uniref:Protein ARV n=1 Tax=Periconia digitata TaxID=1303443 RepID=A0A9W4UNE4_9PLEO|nr:unnamed protein product [Periconia digitata]
MPICIHCRTPISTLYTTYAAADDRALGKGVRLTQCPRCKRFADKYVEHDFVVLFIDLVLIKPEVYRHLLVNRLEGGRRKGGFDKGVEREIYILTKPLSKNLQKSIIRLFILLVLFDVYLTWARIEKSNNNSLSLPSPPHLSSQSTTTSNSSSSSTQHSPPSPLQSQPLLVQYIFFLFLTLLTTLSFHIPIHILTSPPPLPFPLAPFLQSLTRPVTTLYNFLIPHFPHPTLLSTALLVSSCTKLFPMLLLVWEYDLKSAATAVSWAVIVNNVAALEILMGCGFLRAGVLVGVGEGIRGVVERGVLGAVGLGG